MNTTHKLWLIRTSILAGTTQYWYKGRTEYVLENAMTNKQYDALKIITVEELKGLTRKELAEAGFIFMRDLVMIPEFLVPFFTDRETEVVSLAGITKKIKDIDLTDINQATNGWTHYGFTLC